MEFSRYVRVPAEGHFEPVAVDTRPAGAVQDTADRVPGDRVQGDLANADDPAAAAGGVRDTMAMADTVAAAVETAAQDTVPPCDSNGSKNR